MEDRKQYLQKNIENLKAHAKLHSSDSSTGVKVLENVGDYAFVIKFMIFNEYDLNLTIQIPNDCSLSNSAVIVSSSKQSKYSEQQLDEFREFVANVIRSNNEQNDSSSLIKLFNKCSDYVEEQFSKGGQSSPKGKRERKKKNSSTAAKNDNDELTTTKKNSMKTAGDVVNRIQWDEEIEMQFVTVGYLDRFLGLKECAFNTFDWGDIVLADIGSLAIPEHRISYFKYKNELVWDKNNRLDNVFGSTGSNITIYDVIKRLKDKSFVQDHDASTEEVNRVGRVRNNGTHREDHPNYFISIPINASTIQKNFNILKSELIKSNSNLEELIVPEPSLHLTLCTLKINNQEELEKTQQIMKTLALDSEFVGKHFPIKVKFQGIGEFYNKVMFLKCNSDDLDKLASIRSTVLEKLAHEEISTAGNYYDFQPHLTVFKIDSASNRDTADKNGAPKAITELVSSELWQKYESYDFGEMNIVELELCKMTNIFRCLTYPVEFSVKFSV